MKKTKFLATMVSAITFVVSGVGMAGCGGKKAVDSDQHLEMYVLNIGLGYEWAPAIADAFAKEAWVKKNIPILAIPIRLMMNGISQAIE